MNRKEWFFGGFKDGIPIALGYFAVSFTFGMMAVAGGLPAAQAVLISASNITSAGQFAGLSVILADGSYGEIALTQFVVNLRYMLMSFSLSQKFDPNVGRLQRGIAAFGVTDEIFGIAAAQPGRISAWYNFGAMSSAIPGWVLGTLLGALLGEILPAAVMSALGIAIYGMFLAIIIPPARKDMGVLGAVVSAMVLATVITYAPVLKNISSGFMIIIVTVAVSAAFATIRPIPVEDEDS